MCDDLWYVVTYCLIQSWNAENNIKVPNISGFDKTLTPGQLTPYWPPTDPLTDPPTDPL